MFADLRKVHASGPEHVHFMAAVVCLRRGKQVLGTDEFHTVEVVDGQQRLTTLIVLLNAIKLLLDGSDKGQAKLQGELSELLVKVEADELLLLQTNHDSSHHFATYMRTGKAAKVEDATTLADREILMAIEECQKFVVKWIEDGSTLAELAALLKNRIYFLLHEIEDEKSVYTVFEVLNSRGLPVSWFDRLKSILMGIAFELPKVDQASLINDLHVAWRDIYAVVGLRQGMSTEALRYAATLSKAAAANRPLGEEDAVEELRGKAINAAQLRTIASWLLRVVKACDVVHSNIRVNAVTRISQARLLAVAIHLRDDLSEAERDKLLLLWEKVTFRIYGMLNNDARTRVGEYARLAWKVINEKLDVAQITAGIRTIGSAFPINIAIEGLRNSNCYEGWTHELRYFMYRYEEHLAVKSKLKFRNEQWAKIWLASPAKSIEHIWAKSKAPDSHKHSLGNLVLLPPRLNSQLNDDPAKDKVDAYRKTGLLIAVEVADNVAKTDWSAVEIEKREEKLLKWAKKEWAD